MFENLYILLNPGNYPPYFISITVFDLITAPAPPRLTFYFIFIYRPLDDLFPDFYFIFTYYPPLDDLLALVVENKFT